MHPAPFDQLRPGTFLRSSATPDRPLDPSYRGILLAAPAHVPTWSSPGPGLPVAGTARVPLAGLACVSGPGLHDSEVLDRLVLVAATRSGASHLGSMETLAHPIRDPSERAAPLGPGTSTTSYFCLDLASVLDLPRSPATYFVYAFLGPYVSNVVRIDVIDLEASP